MTAEPTGSVDASQDVAALIAGARRPERTVPLCLRGDLFVQMQAAEEAMVEARKSQHTMADRAKVHELAEQVEALRAEMEASTVRVRLRGLGPRAMRALEIEHPAVEGDPEDEGQRWHLATFAPSLVRACIVEPITPEQWDHLLDNELITYGQLDELFAAAFSLSRAKVSVPFSPAASAILQVSGETSE